MKSHLEKRNSSYRYVITETGAPDSLDPLNADNTQNLPVARMIYATPLEVNSKGLLSSLVLKSFEYDSSNAKITWVVKDGIKYTDGSSITPTDVAFAVLRMAYKSPNFPVIEDIVGIHDWAHAPDALSKLPKGITVNGNKIEISFGKPQEHPLFRFCLEIFSIIPKHCVNLNNNEIACSELPGSGHYQIISRTSDKIEFKKIGENRIHGELVPSQIEFRYVTPNDVVRQINEFDDATVITGNELRFLPTEMKTITTTLPTFFTPSSRIGILLLNPHVGAFSDKHCRRTFADSFRKVYQEFVGSERPEEASVFTSVLPGYMKVEELSHQSPISDERRSQCLARMRGEGIPFARVAGKEKSLHAILTKKVFEKLQIPTVAGVALPDRVAEADAFSRNEIGLLPAQTGFWALDPAGDVQMLFAPNMHEMFKFVTGDKELQILVRNLKDGAQDKVGSYKKLNQYLFNDAVFNVFTHVRRFYSSRDKNLIAELPISVTSPSPWQVFQVAR